MIYTSNYKKSWNQPNAISISNSAPPYFKGDKFKLLVPSWDLVSAYKKNLINKEQYAEIYNDCLSLLDVEKIALQLDEKVLLCYETKEDFCHRHLVRKWFNDNGYKTIEL